MSTRQLRAGAGRSAIALPAGTLPLDGFTAVHDELQARVLIVDDGVARIVLVALELTSIFEHTVLDLQRVVATEASAEAADVIVCATHTFSAPHIFPREIGADETSFALEVTAAVRRATASAIAGTRAARIAAGTGVSDVNASRDVPTPHGWWLGVDEFGSTDRTLTVARIEAFDGAVIAVLFNQAVPSAVMSESHTTDGGRLISGDLAGAAARHVETTCPGSVALFLCGAAGDQTPVYAASRPGLDREGVPVRTDVGVEGFALVDLLGARLGRDVLRTLAIVSEGRENDAIELIHDTVEVPGQVSLPFAELRPMRRSPYSPDGTRDVPFVVVRIGPLSVVGTRAEMASGASSAIRRSAPGRALMVASMVNGSAKYLVDASGYDRITYGAMNSQYGRGAAELVRDAIVRRLREPR